MLVPHRPSFQPSSPHFFPSPPILEMASYPTARILQSPPNSASSCQQFLHQRFHFTQVAAIPFRGNLASRRPHRLRRHRLQPRQPRLKGFPASDLPVHIVAVVHPPQRKILKLPLTRMKAISVVDKDRPVAPFPLLARKTACLPFALPSICPAPGCRQTRPGSSPRPSAPRAGNPPPAPASGRHKS